MKVCTKCNEEKEYSQYSKHPQTRDKLVPTCKTCTNVYKKEYRAKNKEMLSEKRKQFYEDNKERSNELSKQYYKDNTEWHKEYARQYYKANRAKSNHVTGEQS